MDAHVVDGVPPYNNYSIRLDDPADAAAKPLKTLYTGSATLLASRSSRRTIDALLTHLSTWALRHRPHLLEVQAVAAVGHGQAVLLPVSLSRHSPKLERPLARAGWGLLASSCVHLDAQTGHLVVSEPQLQVDWEPLAPLRNREPRPASEGPDIAPGRYPVVCWAFPDIRQQVAGLAPAEATLRAAGLTRRPPGVDGQALMNTLAAALTFAHTLVVGSDPAEVADTVLEAVAR